MTVNGRDQLVNHQLDRSIALLGGSLCGIVDVFHPPACEW